MGLPGDFALKLPPPCVNLQLELGSNLEFEFEMKLKAGSDVKADG